MTKLLYDAIRGSSGTADSIQLHASNQSVTFPGNVTCSGTATGFGGGKIVQVKYATKVDTFSTDATSFTDVTGLAATITPTSTSNYIAIWAFINGNTTGSKSYGRIARDSTGIGVGTASGSTVQAGWDMNHGGSSNRAQTTGNVCVEQAQSTSSTVYKVQVRHENGGASVYVNRTSSGTDDASCGRFSSSIIVMEFSV